MAEGAAGAGMPRGIARSQQEQGRSGQGATANPYVLTKNRALGPRLPSARATSPGRGGRRRRRALGHGRARRRSPGCRSPSRRPPSTTRRRNQAGGAGGLAARRGKAGRGHSAPRAPNSADSPALRNGAACHLRHLDPHLGRSITSRTRLFPVGQFDGPLPQSRSVQDVGTRRTRCMGQAHPLYRASSWRPTGDPLLEQ